MNKTREYAQRGFGLVETAIVLAIIGMLVAAIWVGLDRSRRSAMLEIAIEHLVALQHGVRSYYLSQASVPDGDVTAALITAKVVPGDMKNAAGTGLDHPWGVGGITVSGGPVATYPFTFTVTYAGIPTEACIGMAVKAGAGSSANGLTDITIGSTSFNGTSLPVTMDAAAPLCAAAATVTIAFRYKLRLPTQ